MAGSNVGQISNFPSQAVSNKVKESFKYGKQVANSIEQEWFRRDSGYGRFYQTRDEFHRLRLYARGEQSIRKYKDEFAINGDLSYLNLDWKPVPIIPKFVDILTNGMQNRLFHVKAQAQDKSATEKRTKFVQAVERDMNAAGILDNIEQELGVSVRNVPRENVPQNTEELELYMQIGYKQGIEIAQEQAISNVFMRNKYPELKKRLDYDLVVLGIACAKHTFNGTDGISLEYVDPADIVYSYTEDPNFEDCYYFGEVKRFKINQLKKEFPNLKDKELEEIKEKSSGWTDYNSNRYEREDSVDTNTVNVLFFNWKSWVSENHKVKETASGAKKAILKDDTFNPPKDHRSRYQKVSRVEETIFEGCKILGTDIMLKWEKAKNMVRPHSNTNKVMMNYIVTAPRMYKGKIESTVSRITTYADMIQLTHLKIQQAVQRMTPSGIYLDADGLAEIDLGNGTMYNPQEALNMYFQTGSVIGRSLTIDGDANPGKIPIQELPGGGGQQIELLINTYNYYLNMIRDVTGLNEARDGSTPDQYSLVGVQKLAVANSNTATRHILMGSMYLTLTLAEAISLRFKDVLMFHPQKDAFIGALGKFSVGSLEELKNLHLHDFGIFLELEPDEEEKQYLEANIQAALAKDSIFLEDAIDIREIKNTKLANQLLKFRRRKKMEYDAQKAQQDAAAQSEAQAAAQAQIEQAKAQAQQMITEMKISEEKVKGELDIKKLQVESEVKKGLMDHEFQLNLQLQREQLQQQQEMAREKGAMDHNKEAMKLNANKNEVKPQKGFESSGNDVLGGIDLGAFEPK